MKRAGTFSSSAIHKLVKSGRGKTFSAAGETYIKEKSFELLLGRELSTEIGSRPLTWGKVLEKRAFDLMPPEFQLVSQERFKHPDLLWTGAPDFVSRDSKIVGDVKCPFTLKSFCEQVMSLEKGTYKDTHPEYYWQNVSNSILSGIDRGCSVIYLPYLHELAGIREMTENFDGDQNKVAWIGWAQDEDLPYIEEGGYFKNLNLFEYEIPKEDKELLTERVRLAEEELKALLK